jgi:autophagy-related protein 2
MFEPTDRHGDAEVSLRMKRSKLNLHLHSGYDWVRTRRAIEEEAKAIRRRLEKIKQLLAQGQTPDDSIEKTNALLFNSVYIGLDAEDLDEQDLMAAIDANLAEDFETASQESWQSLPIQSTGQRGETKKRRQKTRARSKRAEVEIEVQGLNLEFDKYPDRKPLSSRVLGTVAELKILDHMKTSTWDHFLTSMRTDSRGNRRETESDMVRVELKMVRPVATLLQEEARLRVSLPEIPWPC